ncbi:hypothetical protein [Paenimyroides baculatum]|uniref:SdiA-regulated n=1 Tax=Paenimyroides baculatum TaxID=2608000 RepID=A0A5M6CLY2_9FLAO|nr:hypothetical protein [Paenimyroides baculatum]KAA5536016.1 hypothetical protein F0460_06205 [Paenimyroides baculatum]
MKKYIVFFSFSLLYACSTKSQENNFKEVFTLNKKHTEVSGMIFHQPTQKLWMLQDKGNPSELYIYSVDGTFENTVTVNNQENTDWEDLSQDTKGNIYIGNFGNNDNKRKDLRILKVNGSDLTSNSINTSQETTFYYEDQTDFPPKKSNLLYDCEAFVVTNDTFYLFTKNRSKGFDGTFFVYKVPNKNGNFKAEKIATLQTCSQYKSCAITGAALNKNGNEIALLTHDKVLLIPFLNDDSFKQENITIKELGHNSQKEAITFKSDKELFMADESEKGKKGGKVFVLDLN